MFRPENRLVIVMLAVIHVTFLVSAVLGQAFLAYYQPPRIVSDPTPTQLALSERLLAQNAARVTRFESPGGEVLYRIRQENRNKPTTYVWTAEVPPQVTPDGAPRLTEGDQYNIACRADRTLVATPVGYISYGPCEAGYGITKGLVLYFFLEIFTCLGGWVLRDPDGGRRSRLWFGYLSALCLVASLGVYLYAQAWTAVIENFPVMVFPATIICLAYYKFREPKR